MIIFLFLKPFINLRSSSLSLLLTFKLIQQSGFSYNSSNAEQKSQTVIIKIFQSEKLEKQMLSRKKLISYKETRKVFPTNLIGIKKSENACLEDIINLSLRTVSLRG
mgnify:CR=1 FL=1